MKCLSGWRFAGKPSWLGVQGILLMFAQILLHHPANGQHTPFECDTTVTWKSCIAAYQKMSDASDIARLITVGKTDVGKPLHLFVINTDGIFYPELFDKNKVVVFINNGIHPGEPDGIDASLLLCKELLDPANNLRSLLDSVIVCVVPIYNVDGSLNRGPYSRANQDGPTEYGFRGNARNLDLNRDFIKCDSENARSFTRIFRRVKPLVFVDTHVSNGADYPYTMTLISTQSDKLGGELGSYLREKMTPALFSSMKEKGWEMCPYVNTMGRTPESGLVEFLETPRFASGYAALFNTIGFISETHMLKPFAHRTESTYQFLVSTLQYCHQHRSELIARKQEADEQMLQQKTFPIGWITDTTLCRQLDFKGYDFVEENSQIGDGMRGVYDRSSPWQNQIRYFDRCKTERIAQAPEYYVIPQAWHEVIDRLRWNGVLMHALKNDTTIKVEVTYIESYHSRSEPYEGHFLHNDVVTRKEYQEIQFFAGDFIIPMHQEGRRYLVEVLEPEGEDSYFAWNFFDSCLQQKEWFSDYVFEDKAAKLLQSDPLLKKQFDEAVAADESLASNHWMQLYWIYKRSPYYEKSAFRYPVFRVG